MSLVGDINPVLDSIKRCRWIWHAWIRTISVDTTGREQNYFYNTLNSICCTFLGDFGNPECVVKRTRTFINEKNIIGILLICAAEITIAILETEFYN